MAGVDELGERRGRDPALGLPPSDREAGVGDLVGAVVAADLGDLGLRQLGEHRLDRRQLEPIAGGDRSRSAPGIRARVDLAAGCALGDDPAVDDVPHLRRFTQQSGPHQRTFRDGGMTFEQLVRLHRRSEQPGLGVARHPAGVLDGGDARLHDGVADRTVVRPARSRHRHDGRHRDRDRRQPAWQHFDMNLSTSTTTRVTLPAATRPPESVAETLNEIRRPSILSSSASATTSAPMGVGWR